MRKFRKQALRNEVGSFPFVQKLYLCVMIKKPIRRTSNMRKFSIFIELITK